MVAKAKLLCKGWLLASLYLSVVSCVLADVPVARSVPISEQAASSAQHQNEISIQPQQQARMALRIQELETEIRMLRGSLEEQGHTISQLQQRQRDLYIDMDRRFSQLKQVDSKDSSAQARQQGLSEPTEGQAREVPANSEIERVTIDQAFQLVKDDKLDLAIKKYAGFLESYPNSEYRVNAHYWLGQLYYVKGSVNGALAQFNEVMQRYPGSDKAHDALLKIAYIYRDKGDRVRAKSLLNELVVKYPDSSSVDKAKSALAQLNN